MEGGSIWEKETRKARGAGMEIGVQVTLARLLTR
jgi:hypothetical protein